MLTIKGLISLIAYWLHRLDLKAYEWLKSLEKHESNIEMMKRTSVINTSGEVRERNIKHSITLGLPTIAIGNPNKTKIAIVAGGPSVGDKLQEIFSYKKDGYIIAINEMHDYLISKGVIPDVSIVADANPSMADCYKNPLEEITYLICSQCDPSVFEALKGKPIILWNAAKKKNEKGTTAVYTGPSAATAATYLMFLLGYRDINLYGVDSSLSGEQTHIYGDDPEYKTRIQVMVGDKVYLTTGQLVLQAAHFWELHDELDSDFKMNIHGYGLTKAIFANNGKYEVI